MARQRSLEQLIGGYEVFTESPDSFGAELDECIWERDEIEDRRSELTPAWSARLARADAALRRRPLAAFEDAGITPGDLREGENKPRERWWWYLDEVAAQTRAA